MWASAREHRHLMLWEQPIKRVPCRHTHLPTACPGIGANLSAFLPRWAAISEFFLEISTTLMDMQCNSTDHSKICFIFKIKITLTLDCSDFVSVNPENHFKHISITLPFSNYVKSSCSSLKGTAVQIGLVLLTNDIYVWKYTACVFYIR